MSAGHTNVTNDRRQTDGACYGEKVVQNPHDPRIRITTKS